MQFIRKMSDGVSASPPPKDLDISGSPPLPMEHSSNDKHTSKSPSPAPSLVDEKKSPSPEPAVKDKDSKTPSPQPTKITESEPSKQTAASQSAEKTPSPSEVSDPITASYIEIINKLQSDSTESGGGKPVLAQIDDPMTRSTLFEQDIDSSDVPEYEKTQVGAEIDPLQPGDEHTIKKSHHRLMLTASSEDGGGETEFDTAPLTSQEKGIKIEPEKHTDVGVSSAVRVSTPPSSSAEKKTSSTGVNVDKFSIPEDVKTIERAVDKQIELDHSSIFVAANVPLKDDIEISSTKMYDSSKVSNTERVPSPGYESDHDNVPPSPHSDISSGQMSRDPHVWDDNRSSSRQSEISDKDISSPPFTTSKMKFDVTPQSVMTGSFYGGLPGDEEFAPIESIAKDVKDSKNQIAKLGEIAIATESAVSELLPMAGPSLSSQEKAEPKSTSTAPKDPIESWGKPLGLPSPAPPATNDTIGSQHGTPKKEKTAAAKKAVDRSKAKSNKDASTKNKIPTSPMYFDLTYVPHHGNSNYSQVEFFKNVRARYYVFSGIEPSKEVYDALLEGKQSWDEKDLEVTIIPTYDTDTLGQWVAENEESIALNKIDLSPSASRCTINLQDHETSCSAYRLEF
ncbi:Hypothetical predicted protein [Cloeon dipterum]|uniref:Microtubule-associated protein futsch n=1 Tax=Cloeon dipterum TaxID=197152 RepID=A0A8S1C8L6_9INSE|nr:Hypothetical predicted protein [Cloeon dipterum]